MMNTRKPPTTVVAAVIITALFALLSVAAAVNSLTEPDGSVAGIVGVLVVAALFGLLAWRLWAGSRGAQLTAVVVSAALLVLMLVGDYEFLRWIVAPGAIAIIALLTVPTSSREYFGGHRHQTQLT